MPSRRSAPVRLLLAILMVCGSWLVLPTPATAVAPPVVFDTSVGTAAPPSTLGGLPMMPLAESRPGGGRVSSVPSPLGDVGLSPSQTIYYFGGAYSGHGYTGATYLESYVSTVTITLPPGTGAFYFYAYNNLLDTEYVITATAEEGGATASQPVRTTAKGKYFGVYTPSPQTDLTSVTISNPSEAMGIAIEEMAIAPEDFDAELTPADASTPAGVGVDYDMVLPAGGATVTPDRLELSPATPGASCTGTVCSATQAGVYTVIGTYEDPVTAEVFFGHTTLTVTPGPASAVALSPTDATTTAGTPVAYDVVTTDEHANVRDDASTVTATPTGGGTAVACPQGVCDLTSAGTYTVLATVAGTALTASTGLSVTAGPLTRLTLAPAVTTTTPGTPVSYTVTGADAFGNDLGDRTATSSLSIAPSDGGASTPCTGATCTSSTPGTYTVTAIDGAGSGTATLVVASEGTTLTLGPIGSPTYGDDIATTAQVTSPSGPVTGTVQFAVDGVTVGTPVPVPADGNVTGPVLSDIGAGVHSLTATYASVPTGAFEPASAEQTFVVAKAATVTTVSVTADSVTAAVAAGSAGTPQGDVVLAIDGKTVATVPLIDGVATWTGDTTGAADSAVTATYQGNDDYLASAASSARQDPTITATTSGKPTHGWYAAPVTVTFDCVAGSAAVTCPAPVTIASEGAGQTVTRTVVAADGGIARVTSDPVSIDLTAPTAAAGGVQAGRTYRGTTPQAWCTSSDTLSGVGTCTVSTTTDYPGKVVSTVTVTDLAGNVTTAQSVYRVVDVWVSMSRLSRGAWTLPKGETRPLQVVVEKTKVRPQLRNARGRIVAVGRFAAHKDGRAQWTFRFALPTGTSVGEVVRYRLKTASGVRTIRFRAVR